LDAGAEPIDELAARFTREYRSTQPFLTRVVAEHWMRDSALGRQGAPGALEAGPSTADASRVETTLLFAKDNSNFLGRGGLCDRTDGVPFHEAWSHVAAHAAGDTDRRCYFRAPLAVELRRDIDFTAARVVFGGEEKRKSQRLGRRRDQRTAAPVLRANVLRVGIEPRVRHAASLRPVPRAVDTTGWDEEGAINRAGALEVDAPQPAVARESEQLAG